jgi:hypothetical protein
VKPVRPISELFSDLDAATVAQSKAVCAILWRLHLTKIVRELKPKGDALKMMRKFAAIGYNESFEVILRKLRADKVGGR